jgi:hypothetical protein
MYKNEGSKRTNSLVVYKEAQQMKHAIERVMFCLQGGA